jgi:excisionase family DNA binding protein
MPVKEGWLTTAEAAEVLGLSQGTVKLAITRGTLKARKVSRINMITSEDLEEYRREHLGRQGWEKRREPGYVPDPKRKARRERMRERMTVQPQQPATEPAEKD